MSKVCSAGQIDNLGVTLDAFLSLTVNRTLSPIHPTFKMPVKSIYFSPGIVGERQGPGSRSSWEQERPHLFCTFPKLVEPSCLKGLFTPSYFYTTLFNALNSFQALGFRVHHRKNFRLFVSLQAAIGILRVAGRAGMCILANPLMCV